MGPAVDVGFRRCEGLSLNDRWLKDFFLFCFDDGLLLLESF